MTTPIIDPVVATQIASLAAEIAALSGAITAGVTRYSYDGRSVEYDDLDGMFRRLAFAQRMLSQLQNPGVRRPTVGRASFNKGYRPVFGGGYYTRYGF